MKRNRQKGSHYPKICKDTHDCRIEVGSLVRMCRLVEGGGIEGVRRKLIGT